MKPSFHQPAASRIFWLLAFIVWLLIFCELIHAGFQPDHWPLRHIESGALPYPTASVITFALIVLLEIAVLGLIVRQWRFRRLWLRMLIGVFPWLGWTALWGMTAMHQSLVRDVHLNWLLAVTVFYLLALLVIVPASVWPRLRSWLSS